MLGSSSLVGALAGTEAVTVSVVASSVSSSAEVGSGGGSVSALGAVEDGALVLSLAISDEAGGTLLLAVQPPNNARKKQTSNIHLLFMTAATPFPQEKAERNVRRFVLPFEVFCVPHLRRGTRGYLSDRVHNIPPV
jgi:hypothetical protein